jgi:hypothetical protein
MSKEREVVINVIGVNNIGPVKREFIDNKGNKYVVNGNSFLGGDIKKFLNIGQGDQLIFTYEEVLTRCRLVKKQRKDIPESLKKTIPDHDYTWYCPVCGTYGNTDSWNPGDINKVYEAHGDKSPACPAKNVIVVNREGVIQKDLQEFVTRTT